MRSRETGNPVFNQCDQSNTGGVLFAFVDLVSDAGT